VSAYALTTDYAAHFSFAATACFRTFQGAPFSVDTAERSSPARRSKYHWIMARTLLDDSAATKSDERIAARPRRVAIVPVRLTEGERDQLVVFVKGQRPAGQRPPAERGRAFQATGLQILFALLARPELVARPYREIAVDAGVAHGTVGEVMAELPGLGYLADVGGRRRLINGERLLDQWTEAYARTLRPRLLLGRFRGNVEALYSRTADWPKDLLVGGELAAARLSRHLRTGTATFYAQAIDPKAGLKLHLKADAEGNVDFRRRFWGFPGEKPHLTPTLLVYADLLAIGDARCLETAQLLRGQLIARFV